MERNLPLADINILFRFLVKNFTSKLAEWNPFHFASLGVKFQLKALNPNNSISRE